MDVLLVDTLSVPGGAERALAHLAAALPATGIRPRAIVGETGPLVGWLEAGHCPVEVADDLGESIRRSLASHATDAVLSVGARGHLAAAPAAAEAEVPAVWWMELLPNRRPVELTVRTLPTAAIMAPSPEVAAAQRTLLDDADVAVDVHVVPPGIPTDALWARRSEREAARAAFGWSDRTVVGLVARLDRNKGQASVIDAASRLLEADDTLHFVIAGGAVLGWEGPIAEQLATLVDRRGLHDRVEFLGHLEDTVPVQAALDVAVNASVHESFGLSVLESMTLGTPVVATRTSGSCFLLDDGRAGWLCDPLDNGALARTIDAAVRALRTVDRPDELDRVRNAQRRARGFDSSRTARHVAELLRHVAGGRAGTERPGSPGAARTTGR